MNQPVDFVIAWVDGNDPEWQADKAKYNPEKSNGDAREIRYREWDNLHYWFRAVEKFTPWVNKIHLVTWGHVPEWLNLDSPKLHVARHDSFIPGEYLPTFSARPIEINLHRIEGLSDQFVFFNDDMFIIRPMQQDEFFRDGLPRDTGILSPYFADVRNSTSTAVMNDMEIINTTFSRKKTIKDKPLNWFNPIYGSLNRFNIASLMYPRWYPGFWGSHFPNCYLKRTYETVWAKEFDIMHKSSLHKFRDRRDVNQWLLRYWQLASNDFIPREVSGRRYFPIKNDTSPITKAITEQAYKIVCLNDREGIDDFELVKAEIQAAFEAILPEKSAFEK